jgi:hypothetical protein
MFIQDGQGRFLDVNGGYSPKDDDGSYLNVQKDTISSTFNGGFFIADCGFDAGKTIPNVKFYISYEKPKGRRPANSNSMTGYRQLTRDQEKWNEEVRSVREIVELPYAIVKNMFKPLNTLFHESKMAQNCLFLLACAIHNNKY